MKKPFKLKPGNTLGVVSPSWGGPSVFPHVYENGIKNLKELGFNIVEFPTARMDAEKLYKNPRLRADDINDAFSDDSIHGVITTIGGSDSARILKYLDIDLIKDHPKFLMGYSDIATLNTYLNLHGLVTFNGPTVMAGLSQFKSFSSEYQDYLRRYLFEPEEKSVLPEFPLFCDGYASWGDKAKVGELGDLKKSDGLHFIQGEKRAAGKLYGGCFEVLEMLKGTDFWPAKEFWNGKILILETSEEKPSVDYVQYWLRNYGVMEVFDRVSGILIGRPKDYTLEDKQRLEDRIVNVVGKEFGKPDLPVVCNVDFGHTDPQIILPLGIEFEIDPAARKVIQLESAFAAV